MRIIFLDIDGVVCTFRALNRAYSEWFGIEEQPLAEGCIAENVDLELEKCKKNNLKKPNFHCDYWPFDREAVNLLHKIVRENDDVKFVISSTWRKGETIKSLHNKLSLKGMQIPILGFTENNDKSRGQQIDDWMKFNKDEYGVTNYCVIDDEIKFDVIPTTPEDVCVETEFCYGFTQKHYELTMEILNK